jgi:hypothetical protein
MRAFEGVGRGRPRRRLEEPDQGTPEVQARRATLAAGGDPALTEYPLGLLLARGVIGAEQHEAGCYYAFLYGRAVGRTQVSCERQYGRMMAEGALDRRLLSDEAQAQIEALFRRGKNRLLAAGRRVCDATENVVVFGRIPRFLDGSGWSNAAIRRSDLIERDAVLAGLDALVACYGRAAGRAGRMEAHKAASLIAAPAAPPPATASRRPPAVATGVNFRLTR